MVHGSSAAQLQVNRYCSACNPEECETIEILARVYYQIARMHETHL
jgi:hypothetical protein